VCDNKSIIYVRPQQTTEMKIDARLTSFPEFVFPLKINNTIEYIILYNIFSVIIINILLKTASFDTVVGNLTTYTQSDRKTYILANNARDHIYIYIYILCNICTSHIRKKKKIIISFYHLV